MATSPGHSTFFYSLTKLVLSVLYKLFFGFKAYHTENIPQDPRGLIFAPNHASYLDPPIIGISIRRQVTYLAKEYLFRPFLLGTVLRWLGVLPIKGETGNLKSVRQLLRVLKEKRCIVVFPEGTRTLDGEFRAAEGGIGFLALKSKATVVPVYIEGTFQAFPKGKKMFRPHPVRAYFGRPFIPARDPAIQAAKDPHLAVAERVMKEIRKMKREASKPS